VCEWKRFPSGGVFSRWCKFSIVISFRIIVFISEVIYLKKFFISIRLCVFYNKVINQILSLSFDMN